MSQTYGRKQSKRTDLWGGGWGGLWVRQLAVPKWMHPLHFLIKSWINNVCLSLKCANQLFVYLAAPRLLAHMPAWPASLVTQVRTLPASLGHKAVCVCEEACVSSSVTIKVPRVTDHP